MADFLGIGISHYPPLCMPDERMSGILRYALDDPGIPESAKDPAVWPAAMRDEWGEGPDTAADRDLYQAMVQGDHSAWRSRTTAQFEYAGQQEMLNWCPLLGAMQELGMALAWSSFVETHVFNSNKVFAVYKAP
jgi:hypothetical protein